MAGLWSWMDLLSMRTDKRSDLDLWYATMAHFRKGCWRYPRKKGEEGYVISIGTFLQQYYIYGVEFLESGFRVGMKRKELESAELLIDGGRA